MSQKLQLLKVKPLVLICFKFQFKPWCSEISNEAVYVPMFLEPFLSRLLSLPASRSERSSSGTKFKAELFLHRELSTSADRLFQNVWKIPNDRSVTMRTSHKKFVNVSAFNRKIDPLGRFCYFFSSSCLHVLNIIDVLLFDKTHHPESFALLQWQSLCIV